MKSRSTMRSIIVRLGMRDDEDNGDVFACLHKTRQFVVTNHTAKQSRIMSATVSKVIVFGATGAIGTSLIEIIHEKQPTGEILAVSRSGPNDDSPLAKIPQVTIVKGDVEDLETVQELTKDVQLVFCTVGFTQYESKYWAKHWPVVVDNLLAVTNESRPLVFCDNLYAYGPCTNISPSSPAVSPSTNSKPAIRALLHQKFQGRMDTLPKSIVVVGGADFFGSGVTNMSFLGDTFVGKMVRGNKPLAIGTVDATHDFCYTKDFANALYIASVNPNEAFGKFWICPHSIHDMSMRQIADQVNALLESPVKGVSVMPTFMVYVLSPFMGFMKELKEMLPFWTKDYSVDDSDFCDTFGIAATPPHDALREYVEFYKSIQETTSK
jgi:nucleoside-diphosphate-sugar epimerase